MNKNRSIDKGILYSYSMEGTQSPLVVERGREKEKRERKRRKAKEEEKKESYFSRTGSGDALQGPAFLSTSDDVPRQLADRPPFSGFSSARPTVPIFIFIAAPVNATSTYTGVP